MDGIVSIKVTIDGSPIPDGMGIESVVINRNFNKIPSLKIAFLDGGVDDINFSVLQGLKASPGAKIEVQLGYDNSTATVFKGIVIKNAISIAGTDFTVEIEARDESLKLTSGRKNAVYQKKKDSDIISELAKSASLSVKATATTVEYPEIVQYGCSNWDFLVMRAELNSMVVSPIDGVVNVFKPDPSAAAVTSIENGMNAFAVNLEIDSTLQFAEAKTLGWDSKTQKVLENSSTGTSTDFGTITSKKLSSVINSEAYLLNTSLQVEKDQLDSWGNALLLKSMLNMVKGTIELGGFSKIKPGDVVELKGYGKDFNGKLLVSGIEHVVRDLEWRTILTIGMPFNWFAEQNADVANPSASGLVAPMKGLSIGVVTKIHEDPDGQYRVQVSLPVLGADKGNLSINARMANLYATNASGSFFYPEINDEVLLGFLNEDPHQPVILGMLYSSKNKPPFEPDEKNQFKGIVSKSLITIKMDDVDKILTISTPGENIVTLDDKEGQIVLTDKNKNTVTMSKDGVTIESAKDIILKAKGNIQMEAQSNIELKATADLKGAGMNVALEAQTGLTAKGSATAELSASGQTTVKGAMVMIN